LAIRVELPAKFPPGPQGGGWKEFFWKGHHPMALTNAEKQRAWRERHIIKRRDAQRVANLLICQDLADLRFCTQLQAVPPRLFLRAERSQCVVARQSRLASHHHRVNSTPKSDPNRDRRHCSVQPLINERFRRLAASDW
jgi:hypothetical protein